MRALENDGITKQNSEETIGNHIPNLYIQEYNIIKALSNMEQTCRNRVMTDYNIVSALEKIEKDSTTLNSLTRDILYSLVCDLYYLPLIKMHHTLVPDTIEPFKIAYKKAYNMELQIVKKYKEVHEMKICFEVFKVFDNKDKVTYKEKLERFEARLTDKDRRYISNLKSNIPIIGR